MTRRERRQKVRFIENQGVGFGQNLGHALLPQAQIRQKQMVIDDDDARAAGAFAGAIHITLVVIAAFWPRQFSRVEVASGHSGESAATPGASAISPSTVAAAKRSIFWNSSECAISRARRASRKRWRQR